MDKNELVAKYLTIVIKRLYEESESVQAQYSVAITRITGLLAKHKPIMPDDKIGMELVEELNGLIQECDFEKRAIADLINVMSSDRREALEGKWQENYA